MGLARVASGGRGRGAQTHPLNPETGYPMSMPKTALPAPDERRRPPRRSKRITTPEPAAEEDALRVALAERFTRLVHGRGLTHMQTAVIVGSSQSAVGAILRGDLRAVSIDRLLRFLSCLGQDVTVHFGDYNAERTGHLAANE